MFGFEKELIKLGEELQTDLHSHLIPGVDDGAPDLETALFLIKGMIQLGYKKLIITPHIHHEDYPNAPFSLIQAFHDLNAKIKSENLPIEIFLGAEYFLDSSFISRMEKEELLHFGKRWVLVETSLYAPFNPLIEVLFQIRLKGYQPILAHPERYRYIEDPEWLKKTRDTGCLFQVNILSYLGGYGKKAKNLAWYLLENGLVDFLGSDIHHKRALLSLENFPMDKKFLSLLSKNPILNKDF